MKEKESLKETYFKSRAEELIKELIEEGINDFDDAVNGLTSLHADALHLLQEEDKSVVEDMVSKNCELVKLLGVEVKDNILALLDKITEIYELKIEVKIFKRDLKNQIEKAFIHELLGVEWRFIATNSDLDVLYKHEKKCMYFGCLYLAIRHLKTPHDLELIARGFNRDNFLKLIETKEGELRIYFHDHYYNFLHVGEACRVLKDDIHVLQNKEGVLFCSKESFPYHVIVLPVK